MYVCMYVWMFSSSSSKLPSVFFFQASPTGMWEGHTYLLNDNFVFVFVDGFVAVVGMYPRWVQKKLLRSSNLNQSWRLMKNSIED